MEKLEPIFLSKKSTKLRPFKIGGLTQNHEQCPNIMSFLPMEQDVTYFIQGVLLKVFEQDKA